LVYLAASHFLTTQSFRTHVCWEQLWRFVLKWQRKCQLRSSW